MKQGMRTVAVLTALWLTLSLTACAAPSVYTVGSVRYSEGMVEYYYAAYKYLYLSTYKNEGAKDSEEGWATLYGEKTHGERFDALFRERLLTRATAAALFEGAGLTSRYSSLLKSMMNEATEATFFYEDADNAAEYSELLKPYGASYEEMQRVLLYECEYMLYFNVLFGTNGSQILNKSDFDEDVKDFYDRYYLRVKIAAVADEAKKAAAATAFSSAGSDSAFDALVQNYAENETTDGFFYVYGQYDTAMIPLALLNKIGEVSVGENESVSVDGVDYYVRRYATGEEYKEAKYSELFSGFSEYAARYCYREYLLEKAEEADFSFLDGYTPLAVTTCKEHNAIDQLEQLY